MTDPEVLDPVELIHSLEMSLQWDSPEFMTGEASAERLAFAQHLEVPGVLFTPDNLEGRSDDMANIIHAMRAIGKAGPGTDGYEQYGLPADDRTVILIIAEGGNPPTRRLMGRAVEVDPSYHPFIREGELSLYGGRLAVDDSDLGSKRLVMSKETQERIQGRHVVVGEDVVDTGSSLEVVTNTLEELGATGVDLIAGTRKQVEGQRDIHKLFRNVFYATETPDNFLSGDGMDDPPDDQFRMTKAQLVSRVQVDTPNSLERFQETMNVLGDAANRAVDILLLDPEEFKPSAIGVWLPSGELQRVSLHDYNMRVASPKE